MLLRIDTLLLIHAKNVLGRFLVLIAELTRSLISSFTNVASILSMSVSAIKQIFDISGMTALQTEDGTKIEEGRLRIYFFNRKRCVR